MTYSRSAAEDFLHIGIVFVVDYILSFDFQEHLARIVLDTLRSPCRLPRCSYIIGFKDNAYVVFQLPCSIVFTSFLLIRSNIYYRRSTCG